MGIITIGPVSNAIDHFPAYDACSELCMPKTASAGVDVDWQQAKFTPISKIAAIAAVQLCGQINGVRQKYISPPEDAAGYFSRINYYRVLNISHKERFTRHDPSGRFVPLSRVPINELTADVNGIASQLRDVITSHLQISQSLGNTLDLSFGEMIDNIIQHSRANSDGIVGAQYYPKRHYIEVCVADCGVGIAKSMGDNPSYAGLSDRELVSKAFKVGTGEWFGVMPAGSSKVSGGKGLSFAANLARITGGHLWVVTKNVALHITSDSEEILSGLFYPGTFIVLRVPETRSEIRACDLSLPGGSSVVRWEVGEGLYTEPENDVLW